MLSQVGRLILEELVTAIPLFISEHPLRLHDTSNTKKKYVLVAKKKKTYKMLSLAPQLGGLKGLCTLHKTKII